MKHSQHKILECNPVIDKKEVLVCGGVMLTSVCTHDCCHHWTLDTGYEICNIASTIRIKYLVSCTSISTELHRLKKLIIPVHRTVSVQQGDMSI